MGKDDHVDADIEALLLDRDAQIRAARDELVSRESARTGGAESALVS
ncbi:hypothetical protein [Microbispora sp. CA-102843]